MEYSKCQHQILSLLQQGENNGVFLRDLCKFTGLPNRDLRKSIETLRRNGVVVLSGKTGYYYPADLHELKAYRRQEENRATSILISLQSAIALEDHMTAQEHT